jgi:hypothetical protein
MRQFHWPSAQHCALSLIFKQCGRRRVPVGKAVTVIRCQPLSSHFPGQAGQAALGPVTVGCGRFNRESKREGFQEGLVPSRLERHACFCELGGQHDCCHTIDVSMPTKSGFEGRWRDVEAAGAGPWPRPTPRLKWLLCPVFPWVEKGGSIRSASASTKEDSFSSVYPSSSSFWLEQCLATRASDLVGPPRVRGSLFESSARRRAAAPVS